MFNFKSVIAFILISSMTIIPVWGQTPSRSLSQPSSSISILHSGIWRIYIQQADKKTSPFLQSSRAFQVDTFDEDTLIAVVNRDLPLLNTHINALQISGTLPLMMRFTLKESRWYWWDKEWLSVVLPLHLTYNPLTERYQVRRLQQMYYHKTLETLMQQTLRFAWPVFPVKIVPSGNYYAELTLSINRHSLSLPLQVESATNSDWQWKLKFPPLSLHLP